MGAEDELDRLFRRWIQGADIDALGRLFDGVAPGLFRAAIHLVGDAARAEDLVQSVFLMAIERRESIDPGAPAMAWAMRVLHSKVVDGRRSDAHRGSSTLGMDGLVARTAAAPNEAPDEAVEQRELVRWNGSPLNEFRAFRPVAALPNLGRNYCYALRFGRRPSPAFRTLGLRTIRHLANL